MSANPIGTAGSGTAGDEPSPVSSGGAGAESGPLAGGAPAKPDASGTQPAGRGSNAGNATAGSAGKRPTGGSGGSAPKAGHSAQAGRAGDDADSGTADPSSCGDTRSDPQNCGECGRVCSGAHAAARCSDGSCALDACEAGYADCDATFDNGCEIALNTLAHCGACDRACAPIDNGLMTCAANSCSALRARVGPAAPASSEPVHGSVGGAVYDLLCPVGEVLTGLEAGVYQEAVHAFNVRCAPVVLSGTPEAPVVKLGEAHVLPASAGDLTNSALEVQRFDCPSDTWVSGVAGWLIQYAGESRLFIRTISLACSRAQSAGGDRFSFVPMVIVPPGSSQSEGDTTYSDMCGAGKVVVGFTGFAGAAIDGLQTHCADLTTERSTSTPSQ